jgi:hypothetical protein
LPLPVLACLIELTLPAGPSLISCETFIQFGHPYYL